MVKLNRIRVKYQQYIEFLTWCLREYGTGQPTATVSSANASRQQAAEFLTQTLGKMSYNITDFRSCDSTGFTMIFMLYLSPEMGKCSGLITQAIKGLNWAKLRRISTLAMYERRQKTQCCISALFSRATHISPLESKIQVSFVSLCYRQFLHLTKREEVLYSKRVELSSSINTHTWHLNIHFQHLTAKITLFEYPVLNFAHRVFPSWCFSLLTQSSGQEICS